MELRLVRRLRRDCHLHRWLTRDIDMRLYLRVLIGMLLSQERISSTVHSCASCVGLSLGDHLSKHHVAMHSTSPLFQHSTRNPALSVQSINTF